MPRRWLGAGRSGDLRSGLLRPGPGPGGRATPPPTLNFRFFVTCARGTEGPLRRELIALRAYKPRGERGGVGFEGDLRLGMAVCLRSRVAMRVLMELGSFDAADPAALYAGTRTVPWSDWMTARSTLAVHATVRDSRITHSGYAALKVKDAIVDSLRDHLGARPDVAADPDVAVVLHLASDRAVLYLDMAGEPLHRRGYRTAQGTAPLKENLAAAVIELGRIERDRPLIDPMCGSGTFLIEHALAARRIAPGSNRRFGFERWPTHGEAERLVLRELRDAARAAELPRAPAMILGREISPAALDTARTNVAAAGVGADVRLEPGDVARLDPGGTPGTIVCNPPYGERLKEDVADLYRSMAAAFARLPDWRLVLLAGNPLLPRAIGRKPDVSHRLWNGPLEVRLLAYEATAGRSPPVDRRRPPAR